MVDIMSNDFIRRKNLQKNMVNIDSILNAKINQKPWPHAVIDNVFNINLETSDANNSHIIWLNNIHDIFYDNIEPILNKYRSDRGGYEELYKDDYYVDYALQVQTPHQKSEIHIDHGRKLWSFVSYLFPKNSSGTKLYDKDKNFLQEIEWKQNRAFAFCSRGGDINPTWHDYGNNSDEYRVTLAVFICKDK
jgi:hypothetical protein